MQRAAVATACSGSKLESKIGDFRPFPYEFGPPFCVAFGATINVKGRRHRRVLELGPHQPDPLHTVHVVPAR